MTDSILNRPADLGANDAGFVFRALDNGTEYVWNGSAWAAVIVSGGTASTIAVTY